jgi:hypothetical protein
MFDNSTNRFLIFLSLKWQEFCDNYKFLLGVTGALAVYFGVMCLIEFGTKSTIPWLVFCGYLTLWISGALIGLFMFAIFCGLTYGFVKFLYDNWKKAGWIQKERKKANYGKGHTDVFWS